MRIIDADGHVNDRAALDEIAKFMPKKNQITRIFPPFDHFHSFYLRPEHPTMMTPGASEWLEFMDETGIESTVVYPTAGLAVGRIVSWEWAFAACQAYNNWLYERFTNLSPRIKGVALIPIQNIEFAVHELRRAVNELGFTGAMLPSNGEGLKSQLGDPLYWPIYEEAEKLGCCLAVHGGCHHHLGLDSFNVYFPVHALAHPIGIMIQAAAMLSHGVFDRFTRLRVAFLEGGAAWVPFLMDRFDRSYNECHRQLNLDGTPVTGPRPGEKGSDYIRRHVREGRIFVGFDCDDNGLGDAVRRVGPEPFLFASDFPHEVFDAVSCRHEIDELIHRDDLGQTDKEAVLSQNAIRLYGM
jgi:hypothetical protein